MSVILYSAEYFKQLYQELLANHPTIGNMRLFPLTVEQKQQDLDKQDLEIGKFVLRLALANGAAYIEQYPNSKAEVEKRNLELGTVPLNHLWLRHIEPFQLWEKLTMLEYNCTTNNGHDRISEKDNETLRQLMSVSVVHA